MNLTYAHIIFSLLSLHEQIEERKDSVLEMIAEMIWT